MKNVNVKDVYTKIDEGAYNVEFVKGLSKFNKEERAKELKAYNEKNSKKVQEFEVDAIDAVGLKDHPRAGKAFGLAWRNGHAYGYGEVMNHLEEIADVLIGD